MPLATAAALRRDYGLPAPLAREIVADQVQAVMRGHLLLRAWALVWALLLAFFVLRPMFGGADPLQSPVGWLLWFLLPALGWWGLAHWLASPAIRAEAARRATRIGPTLSR